MNDKAEYRPLAAAKAPAAGASNSCYAELTFIHYVYAVLLSILIVGIIAAFDAVDSTPEPRLFVRLVEADGLQIDPCAAEARSPAFSLAVEADGITQRKRGPCAGGGGDALLRVSYRGVILAWGRVPQFCVDGRSMRGSSATVARVVATSEGSELRAEMRNMIHAETQAFGDAEFDVDGEIPGLGHLRCKTYLVQDESVHSLPPCTYGS